MHTVLQNGIVKSSVARQCKFRLPFRTNCVATFGFFLVPKTYQAKYQQALDFSAGSIDRILRILASYREKQAFQFVDPSDLILMYALLNSSGTGPENFGIRRR
jgi:hypothetical protein